jgi:hypothetical protein
MAGWRYPPPGGFAGFAQETPAQQSVFTKGGMSNGGTRRRAKKKAKAAAPRRRKKSSGKAGTGKGSAAMKRKMARLRRMRKK